MQHIDFDYVTTIEPLALVSAVCARRNMMIGFNLITFLRVTWFERISVGV